MTPPPTSLPASTPTPAPSAWASLLASTGEGPTPDQHPLPVSIGLHLAPGILIGAIYFATVPLARERGLPLFLVLSFAAFVVMVPLVLGGLLLRSRSRGLRAAWREAMPYGRSLPTWQYVVWVFVLLLAAGGLFALFAPVSEKLFAAFFSGLPAPSPLDASMQGSPWAALWLAIFVVSIVVVVPVLEEIYFRGFLLSRIDRLGYWAPVLGTVLFALYHTWTPWLGLSRIAAILPLSLVVFRKRCLWVGILVHVIANSTEAIAAAAALIKG